ncbi:MAG: beta-lactamase family protein [Gemmatimonadota bacterium]|jgi:CubicO group peptidase (beta-lactamase class C family)|nr:beta-lactamase family protein [Gemmatimonadota bacterium]
MLSSLFVAAIAMASPDTVPFAEPVLLGETLSPPVMAALSQSWMDAGGGDRVSLLGAEDATRAVLMPASGMFSSNPSPRSAPTEVHVSFATYAAMPLPSSGIAGAPDHTVSEVAELGFSAADLEKAVKAIDAEVHRGAMPGAALAVGRRDHPVLEKGIGTVDLSLNSATVDPDYTIYDLASLTKVVATTTAVMLLWEDGRIDLDAPVRRYVPEFSGGNHDLVTIRHLLTHTSGLPAGGDWERLSHEEIWSRVHSARLQWQPGTRMEYSDIGFMLLWEAAENAYGAPIPELLENRVFGPLEMKYTNFLPGPTCVRCAPTDERPGYRGVVHDPIARGLGGVAGHAGLFSTAHDLSRFAAMLANGGELDGVRVLNPATIKLFTQRQPGAGVRALGWETPDERGVGSGGLSISPGSFGHTGFTGTSLWVDPERGTWAVLLTNRTLHPQGANRIQELRREVNTLVAHSVDSAR